MSQVPWLDPSIIEFPDTADALTYPSGLLAAGGALSSEWLIAAYSHGIFPWYNDGEPILWWSPSPRTIIYINELHISKSLRKTLRKNLYRISVDEAFEATIRACAEPRDIENGESGTWISEEMIQAYCQLHQQGIAHSVEVWHDKQLVGGIYGVALGRVFFGESMFSRKTNCSKIAIYHLEQQLKEWQYIAIDCQVYSDHLASLGAVEVPRATFENILECYVSKTSCHWKLHK